MQCTGRRRTDRLPVLFLLLRNAVVRPKVWAKDPQELGLAGEEGEDGWGGVRNWVLEGGACPALSTTFESSGRVREGSVRNGVPDADGRGEGVLEGISPSVRDPQFPWLSSYGLVLGLSMPCRGWRLTRPLMILYIITKLATVL